MVCDLKENDWKGWGQITEDYGEEDNPNPYQVRWHWDEGKVEYEISASTQLDPNDIRNYTLGILAWIGHYHNGCTMRMEHKSYMDMEWHFYGIFNPSKEEFDKKFDECAGTFICGDEDWKKIVEFTDNLPLNVFCADYPDQPNEITYQFLEEMKSS